MFRQEHDQLPYDVKPNIEEKTQGFVYILEVKDIDLPVCKIGSTRRDPNVRCDEINKGSTGDFIWAMAHCVRVDDCRRLESLVQSKLSPMKQSRREFFNLGANEAWRALISILGSEPGINRVEYELVSEPSEPITQKMKNTSRGSSTRLHSEYTELFDAFTSVLKVAAQPFGQTSRSVFGVSDGNEGVQWNLAVEKDTGRVRLGVNLEGKKYTNWPIATFILSEKGGPQIMSVIAQLERPEDVYLRFVRDAWQATARPLIKEMYIGGAESSLREIDSNRWADILDEALECLNEDANFRGRAKQTVTLASKPKSGGQVRIMQVSPHLNIWTEVKPEGNLEQSLQRQVAALQPVYDWVMSASQS
jgi:hypothetical protein